MATVRLGRPERANALNETAVRGLGEFFAEPPVSVRAAVCRRGRAPRGGHRRGARAGADPTRTASRLRARFTLFRRAVWVSSSVMRARSDRPPPRIRSDARDDAHRSAPQCAGRPAARHLARDRRHGRARGSCRSTQHLEQREGLRDRTPDRRQRARDQSVDPHGASARERHVAGYGLWAEALTTALTQSTAAQEGSKRSSRSVRPSSAATELVSPTAVRSGYSPGSSE